jgi:hypothetical protein
MGERNAGDALRQREVGDMQRVADIQGFHVDFDELRQVFWQAGYFNLGQLWEGPSATLLDANCSGFVDEVQGYVGVSFWSALTRWKSACRMRLSPGGAAGP